MKSIKGVIDNHDGVLKNNEDDYINGDNEFTDDEDEELNIWILFFILKTLII